MQPAEALDGAPAPLGATTFDPYGQLMKMLLPRAQSIAIYDRMGLPVWLNDGLDSPELHRVLQDALAQDLGASGCGDGYAESIDRDHCAYVFLLRGPDARLIGAVGIVCRESRQGNDPRPFALVQGLLRPALECLQRELSAQYSIGDLQRSLMVRDRDLELLLGAAQDEAAAGESTDDLAQLVQGCVDHLNSSVGALLIPDKIVVWQLGFLKVYHSGLQSAIYLSFCILNIAGIFVWMFQTTEYKEMSRALEDSGLDLEPHEAPVVE